MSVVGNRIYAVDPARCVGLKPAAGKPEGASPPPASAAVAPPGADASGAGQADFTRMTRAELRAWVNDQILSGRMSLDESTPFIGLTMAVPVGGPGSGEAGEGERIDFTQKVRDGLEAALSRRDGTTSALLERAMEVMQRHQRKAAGGGVRA